MSSKKSIFISGKFNVIHSGHIRLFRLAKDVASILHVALDSDGLTTEEIDWRVKTLENMELVDAVHVFKTDNSSLISSLKPDFILKGNEFQSKFNSELKIVEKYGGKLIFGSGINFYSENELLHNPKEKKSSDILDLPVDFMSRHNIKHDIFDDFFQLSKDLKVCVIGDVILDEYINCNPIGMSQEDPMISVKAIDSAFFLGGAGIVAAHCKAIGADTEIITVVGSDLTGEKIKEMINKYELKSHILMDETRPSTLKQRYKSRNQTLFKLTQASQEIIDPQIQGMIIDHFKSVVKDVNLLILSDFSYGVLPDFLVEQLIEIANSFGIFVAADSQSSSQVGNLSKFKNLSLVTPTEREARVELRDQTSGLVVLLDKIKNNLIAKNLILKLGADGILIRSSNAEGELLPIEQIEALNKSAIDTSGAGDSLLASSSIALAIGYDLNASALIGSVVAGIQVSRLGNLPISRSDFFKHIKK